MPAKDIGEQGFFGPSQLGPSRPEAGDGHVGPFDPLTGKKDCPDPLGYLGKRASAPFKPATEEPKGT